MTAKHSRTTIRLMGQEDLAFADTLRALVGWNQTRADWERLLRHDPDGCFIAEHLGEPAGTAITTIYTQDLAWIGMVLVHPEKRGVGIGTALLEHCIDHLKGRQIGCIKLDATPQGHRVYTKLGFHEEWPLQRWERSRSGEQTNSIRPLNCCRELERMGEVERLDGLAFGAPRSWLVGDLHRYSEGKVVFPSEDGRVLGFGLLRTGAVAKYLGPIVATDDTAGTTVVHDLMCRAEGSAVYWDIPDSNRAATDLAVSMGFEPQRPLMRMFLGADRVPGDTSLLWGIADPAVG